MLIEKISEDQIRCILTGEDLEKRNLKLSELAYGTEKARALFHDMMQQAAIQFGFHADNTPLMIEAIPMDHGSIVLIITKVDDPEELDTRFSSFGPSVDAPALDNESASPTAFEQLIDSIRRSYVSDTSAEPASDKKTAPAQNMPSPESMQKIRDYMMRNRLFSFRHFSDVCDAASHVALIDQSRSSLFYDESFKRYYLFLSFDTIEEVGAAQNVLAALSEFGSVEIASYARFQQLTEHAKCLFRDNALSELAKV